MNEEDIGVKLEMLLKSGFKSFPKEWALTYRCGYYDINYVSKIIYKKHKKEFNKRLLYYFNRISRYIYTKY